VEQKREGIVLRQFRNWRIDGRRSEHGKRTRSWRAPAHLRWPFEMGMVHTFAQAPDGNRFLVWTFDPDRGDITVLLNWPSLLKK